MSELYKNLSDELKEKIKACKTEEELKNLLAQENIELDPTAMGAVSGGGADNSCPPYLRADNNCPPYLRADNNCPPYLREGLELESSEMGAVSGGLEGADNNCPPILRADNNCPPVLRTDVEGSCKEYMCKWFLREA